MSRALAVMVVAVVVGFGAANSRAAEPIKVGIIGLDTSHALAFTKTLNNAKEGDAAFGCRVVAAYPQGSRDIESSTKRVPEYTQKMKDMGVEIVDSIPALLEKVDAVCLESNDGRVHLEQVRPVIAAGKPVFVDKPVAGSLVDAIVIHELAKKKGVPMFSSSSLRWVENGQALRRGEFGKVLGCDAYSPASLEPTHPDLFWYGIHGVETLYTVMGPGCKTVARSQTPDSEFVVGVWDDGRIGTFRGTRKGQHGYGGTAFTDKRVQPVGKFMGYEPLVAAIVHFFKTGEAPVDSAETLEIYAFMEAADESKRRGGAPVAIQDVMDKARKEAAAKLGD
ncbi:MAG: gfo/Idh/MocA family oxidoreductase [Phycisphaera sp.]|nr:gfo/Idh/MocA family oxidoreductase [Phycisphaera sp.]